MNGLNLIDICAGYGKKEVLRNITLSVEQEKITAIIGPNGAGKSTLLKVITGFLKPTQGSVWLDGREVTASAPHERVKAGVAYFMQGGRVFPSLTVSENLEMGCMRLSPDQRKKNTATVLELFPNLKDMLKRRSGLLSGGERQALALGMVLVSRPRYLLLDEPSAGLSPRLVREALDKVEKINKNWKLTVLIAEQNVRAALGIAHRVCALANGQVVKETEKPEEWLSDGSLEQLFLGIGQGKP